LTVAACLASSACTEHGTSPTSSRVAHLALGAVVQATAATGIELRATFSPAGEGRVELARTIIGLTTQEIAFDINLEPCLADGGDACDVFVELTLLRNTTVLDQTEVGPVRLRPGETTELQTPVQLREVESLRITPSDTSALQLPPGDSLQLTATLLDRTNAPVTDKPVTWTSSNVAVATVNPTTGRVNAVSSGTSQIQAAAGGRTAVVTVTVARVPSITIVNLYRGGTQTPVNPASVSGLLDVVVSFDSAGRPRGVIQILIDGAPVTARLTTGPSCTTCIYQVNTADFDQNTGAPTFPNGAHTLVARLTVTGGSPVLSAPRALTFTNSSGFVVSVSSQSTRPGFPASATNTTTNQVWLGGTVTVRLVAVSQVPGQAYATVSGSFAGRNFTNAPVTNGVASVVFPDATGPLGIAGYQTTSPGGDVPVITAATLVGGGNGATNLLNLPTLTPARIDNAPPAPPTVGSMPVWVFSTFAFASQAGVTMGADGGVGGVSPAFWVVRNGTLPTAPCAVTGLTAVTTGADLTSPTGATFRGRVVTADALGNVQCADLAPGGAPAATFAVDLVPPTATLTSAPASNGVYGGFFRGSPPAFAASVSDAQSGISSTPLFASLQLFTPSGTMCVIGAGSSCAVAAQPSTFPSFTLEGYYIATIEARDIAGNVTPLISNILYLLDSLPPSITNVAVPSSITGSAIPTFNATVVDNVEAATVRSWITYGSLSRSFDLPSATVSGFGLPLVGQTAVPLTFPTFYRCVESSKPYSVAMFANDHGGNFGNTNGVMIDAASIQDCGVAGNVPISSLSIAGPTPSLVSTNGATAGVPTVTTLRAFANTPTTATGNPFTRVDFYWGGSESNYVYIGAGAATLVSLPTARQWTYTLAFDPPSALGQDSLAEIIAIGVDSKGEARILGTTSLSLVP
jgi:hypothetical protein